MNMRCVVRFPIEVPISSITFATCNRALSCNKTTLHFFELLLDISGSKHDSNRLIVVDNNSDCLIRFQRLMRPFISYQMHNKTLLLWMLRFGVDVCNPCIYP